MYPCPHCGDSVFSARQKRWIGPARRVACPRCGRMASVPWLRSFAFMLPFFVGMNVVPAYFAVGFLAGFFDPTTWGWGEWTTLGAVHAALFVSTWLIGYCLSMRWVPLIRADTFIAEVAPPPATGKAAFRPYWRRRFVPELAGLPREARVWLWRDAAWPVLPWILAAVIPFDAICVVTGGLMGAWIVVGAYGQEWIWLTLTGFSMGCAVGAVAFWLVARPVVIHIMRPRLRKAREAAVRRLESRVTTNPGAAP